MPNICYTVFMSIKTVVTNENPREFIAKIEDAKKREDALQLLEMYEKITKNPAKMWGTMIGFDKYHYKSERSRQEGDWPLAAFAARKTALTLYVMPGFANLDKLLAKLGPHKTSVGCLYIKRLSDVDLGVLERIVAKSYADALGRYGSVGK